jgi:cell division protein FtsW
MRFVIFGLTALYICSRIPLGWYRKISILGMIVSIGLLVATIVMGTTLNDAERWISIFGVSFQPSEIAKIALMLYLAKVLEDHKFETFKEFVIWVLAPLGIMLLLILNGSASTALILGGLAFLILIIGGVKWSHLFKSAGIAVVTLLLTVFLNQAFGLFPRIQTLVSRVENFVVKKDIDENLKSQDKQKLLDKTFQADMAKIAIASANVIGKGPGKSTQRYVLPHPYSDFIYSIIVEEWGLMGGVTVLLLYLWFLFRCIAIARNCTKMFSAILVIALGLLITTQAMLHILVNVSLLPVTGHTLPLISLGGTSLIIMSSAFGIILAVSRSVESGKVKVITDEETQNGEQVKAEEIEL